MLRKLPRRHLGRADPLLRRQRDHARLAFEETAEGRRRARRGVDMPQCVRRRPLARPHGLRAVRARRDPAPGLHVRTGPAPTRRHRRVRLGPLDESGRVTSPVSSARTGAERRRASSDVPMGRALGDAGERASFHVCARRERHCREAQVPPQTLMGQFPNFSLGRSWKRQS